MTYNNTASTSSDYILYTRYPCIPPCFEPKCETCSFRGYCRKYQPPYSPQITFTYNMTE